MKGYITESNFFKLNLHTIFFKRVKNHIKTLVNGGGAGRKFKLKITFCFEGLNRNIIRHYNKNIIFKVYNRLKIKNNMAPVSSYILLLINNTRLEI